MADVHVEGAAESLSLAAPALGCKGTLRTRQSLIRGYEDKPIVPVPAPNRPAHAAGPGNTPLLGVTTRFGRRRFTRVRVRR